MHIIFRSPTNHKDLCVAKINSAETDSAANQLILYGSFKGRPALFRIPNPGLMAETLYNYGSSNRCLDYTAEFADGPAEQIIIDFCPYCGANQESEE